VHARARKRVLIVDDDPLVRKSVFRMLCAEMDSTIAEDGAAALDMIRHGAHFDAILCDVMMPGMNGADVYDALCKCAPEQAARTIFMTGATLNPAMSEFLNETRCHLYKPFDLNAARAAIASVSEEGYEVVSAPNGRDALELLRTMSERLPVVVLDLMMPVMSGWQVLTELRKDPKLASVPVILLSAATNLQDHARMLAANGYLQKPIDLSSLVAMLDNAVAHH
jgi:CheY-like chemotaxis protein